ncbi:MAG: alpha-ketoacid dehydrogenase subunit beta [Actinomycetota bacterium]|nr:alpha-ketoacid dehydrogenase subunit beta [Actinomycetota bacterium]
MAQALNRALHDAMAEDDRVLVFGEDVGRLGGVFRITDKLQETFGDERCFDTPLAESAIIGTSLGLALYGFRPVPELQFDAFAYPAFEQLVSHVAKYRNRSRGTVRLPITVRIPYGGGIGAVEHHSESPETYWLHTAGLKVVTPGSPSDAYTMMRQSIASDDPVVVLEPKRRYWMKEDIELSSEGLPLHAGLVRLEGSDVTLVAYGPMVRTALEAAQAGEEQGWSIEVVDLRSLQPLDERTIVESVYKTGRCVVVHEAVQTLGLGAEIAARVQELAFYHLEAPVLRVASFDTPCPPARLEEFWLPDVDRILDFVERSLAY